MKKRGKVLVVEDDSKWSARLQRILEENGFYVIAVNNESEASKLIKSENFHFATVDLQLDECTLRDEDFEGWKILKSLKDTFVPVMVLTGFPGEHYNHRKNAFNKEYSATFFMTKSEFDKQDFIKTVCTCVDNNNFKFYNDHRD